MGANSLHRDPIHAVPRTADDARELLWIFLGRVSTRLYEIRTALGFTKESFVDGFFRGPDYSFAQMRRFIARSGIPIPDEEARWLFDPAYEWVAAAQIERLLAADGFDPWRIDPSGAERSATPGSLGSPRPPIVIIGR